MPLIVDTYNVLHQVGILPPEIAGIDTHGLIELIRNSRYRHESTMLFCDGSPDEGAPTGRIGPVTVRYSGPAAIADDMIAAKIRNSSFPKRLTVVSTDRAVQREARRRRCRILSSEEFLTNLVADHESARPKSRRGADRDDAREAGPDREKTYTPPPRATVLPMDLVKEAEALAQEGVADDPLPPPPEKATDSGLPLEVSTSGGPATAQPESESPDTGQGGSSQSSVAAQPLRAVPPPELVLSAELIREAEAIASAGLSEKPPESPGPPGQVSEVLDAAENAESDESDTSRDEPNPPAISTLDEIITADPPEALIPDDLIQEAESLWQGGAASEGPADPGQSSSNPPPENDHLPKDSAGS